jgi:hypothetical protein
MGGGRGLAPRHAQRVDWVSSGHPGRWLPPAARTMDVKTALLDRDLGVYTLAGCGGTPYGAAADRARLDLDEQVPDSIRPGHRSGLPGRCEQMVVSHRFSESEHQNTPARFVLLIDSVDLERHTGATDQPSERSKRRGTKDDAAVAILIGHGQDLRPVPSHETDPASSVLCEELLAVGL